MNIIVWQEIDCDSGDPFEEFCTVFSGTNHEVDLDLNDFVVTRSPWMGLSEDFRNTLEEMGYGDAILPRGYGNADTAFYAVDMSDYYNEDVIRIALIDEE